MALTRLATHALALTLITAMPVHAQVSFDIRVNTLGFEQRETLTKPDAGFGHVLASDGRLILALGNGGIIHTFVRTASGFVETHPLFEASPLSGRDLAVHNGRAIVGFEYGAGIFQYTDSGWLLEAYVVRSEPAFGVDVDITDDFAIVGGGTAVAIVRREGSAWLDDLEITLPQNLGVHVAVSGHRAYVKHDVRQGVFPRSLYERGPMGWTETSFGTTGTGIGGFDLDGTLLAQEIFSGDPGGSLTIRDFGDTPQTVSRFFADVSSSFGGISVDANRVGLQVPTFFPNVGGAMVLDRNGDKLFEARVTETRGVGLIALAGNILVVGTARFSDQPGMITVFEIPNGSGPPTSPSGRRTPPASQIVDSNLDVWTLSSNLEPLRNGVSPGGLGTQLLFFDNVLYVFGLDDQWWRWTGSGWTPHGPADPSGGGTGLTPSPSGTRSPPAPHIVDANLDVWTLGASLETLRNGVHVTGFGTEYLWYQNTLYVLAFDGIWWRWTGGGWTPHGPTDPSGGGSSVTPSPSGTRSPPATSIVDNDLAVWTIGPGLQTLRNGVHPGGFGTGFLWYQNALYVLGVDNNWWRWTSSTWTFHGPTDPSGS